VTPPEERSGAGAGSTDGDLLELRLRRALAVRATAVPGEPPAAIRAGIDRRIARRAAARRRRRRAIGSTVALVGLVAGVTVVRARDGDGVERVDVTASAGRGEPADPLAAAGLPRITLHAGSGVRPQGTGDPAVQPVPVGPSELTQVQVFRPADALVPVVIAPWSPAGAARDLPEPGADGTTSVDVAGTAAALAGEPPGLATLAWPMADGTRAYLYAYGVGRAELLDLARGLVRAPAGAAGYRVDDPPGALVEQRAPVEPARGTTPGYEVGYVDAAGADAAVLRVRREGAGRFTERLVARLATAAEVHPIDVLGRPALLGRQGPSPGTGWSVLWQPAEGVTAELEIVGGDRAAADRLVAALARADG
jgi:hypothetical protein